MATIDHNALENLWMQAGGTQATADTAAAIAQAESGGDPSAINNTAHPDLPGYHEPAPGNLPEYSIGLWQINQLAHPDYTTAELLDPLQNATAAVAISDHGANFDAWSTYVSGAYKTHLANAAPPPPSQRQTGPGPNTEKGQPAGALSGWSDLSGTASGAVVVAVSHTQRAAVVALQHMTNLWHPGA